MANDDVSKRHFWLHCSLAVIVPDIENIEFTDIYTATVSTRLGSVNFTDDISLNS